MEKLVQYRKAILTILEEHAAHLPANFDQVERQVFADTERDHYQLVTIGWQKGRFIRNTLLHFDLKNGKIWLQYNGTEEDLGQRLQALGVPKSDIVIGWLPPEARALSDYAQA
jgi:hypothetical protein